MAMDFKTFNNLVGAIADARLPVLIRGKHGIGKSETVYQFAASIGKKVVERRASQMTEGDLVGLPIIEGNSTSWNPPDWFKEACDNGVVLFMDEIDRAVQEVRQGFFQMTDSRTINGHKLHPDTLIFAAVNGGVSGAQYSVQDMDPAELDRWTVFDLEPSVEDWIQFAKGKAHDIVVEFIADNHIHLEHKGEFEPNKKYPSRRSWMRLSSVVSSLLDGEGYNHNAQRVFQIAGGFIGFETAVSFQDHLKNRDNALSIDDILVKGKIGSTDKFKLNDHITMVEKIAGSKRCKSDMPVAEIQNLASYFVKLPAEAAMKFYSSISSAGGDVKFVLAFNKMTVNGTSIRAHINEVMTAGKQKKA